MHATDIVAYTYRADNYCPRCIIDVLPTGEGEAFDGWALAAGATMPAEQNLAELAEAFGIDRSDERSYDSGDFPKVVFVDQVEDCEHCGSCHEPFVGECSCVDGDALVAAAAELGTEHGHAAGTWVLDGNSSVETARRILTGLDDGDPEVLDTQPAPLSGEWADGPTPASLADELGYDYDTLADAELMDDVCTAYEDAYSAAYWTEVGRSARCLAGRDQASTGPRPGSGAAPGGGEQAPISWHGDELPGFWTFGRPVEAGTFTHRPVES